MTLINKEITGIRIPLLQQWLTLCVLFLSGASSAQILLPDLSGKQPIDGVSGAAALYRDVGVIENQVIYKQHGIWQRGPVLPVKGKSYSNRHVGVSKRLIVIGSRSQHTVWVFRRSENNWYQEATLTPPADNGSSGYGESVYVDDHLIAVADVRKQLVYLYTKHGDNWELDSTLSAEELPRSGWESFGITMRRVNNELYISDSGADRLLIFRKEHGQWQRSQIIEAPAAEDPNINQKFSFGFDVSRHVLAVSSYMMGSGYVRIYTRSHFKQPWTHTQTIYQSDIDSDQGYFGHDVELDGTTLLIGDDELKKIYRFDLNLQGHWQYSDVLEGEASNSDFGYSFGFSRGTLLIGAKNSVLYTHIFPTVTLSGRVLTQDFLPVKGATIYGYLGQPQTNEYGEYSLDVPLFWFGTLRAKIQDIFSQEEELHPVFRDTSLNDMVFEQPYYVDAHVAITGGRRGCIDPEMKFAELSDEQQRNSGYLISIHTLYGWSGTLTPVSEICQYTPESLSVDFMDTGLFFQLTASNK
ncbi:hypothetical protein [Vibrio mangrovi]|uniref:Uncharacterized protein n=1 Tax=Vibrio mangrovi TaxID=474394 RepID=A0A1Y6IQU6_9VIBR|nr:hypothetical protein [Vibrio mangrovi]MDW6004032.1 hypothetical protein [Vibrio mangrovi]SMR99170.1 hypothetical protein VIM7927_00393 [Vibrio mangrovi]